MDKLPDIFPFQRRLDELDAQMADPSFYNNPRKAAEVSREQQKTQDVNAMDINLGHVLVLVPENASPIALAERQARAQSAADKIRAGADFAAVASEFSDGAEARNAGGLLGLRAGAQQHGEGEGR